MPVKLPIYLDNHATTPVDPRVLEAMLPYFTEHFGNPASGTHPFGWRAEEAVKKAREQVANLIGSAPKEILWTSGTTEAINLAIKGIAAYYPEKGNHLITCVTEHRATLEPCRSLEKKGFRVTYLPVDSAGCVNLDDLKKSITDKTILISLLAAHNEIGTLHPIAEIGKIAKEKGALFHVDAAQACGKIPLDVEMMGIDLMSMSAHKVYGPKGIGALYLRSKNPRVRLEPILHGGTHEGGMRPGTLAVPNIVGMGAAFEIAGQERDQESKQLPRLRDKLRGQLTPALDDIYLTGHPTERLAGNLNLSFMPIRADLLLGQLADIALSSGSACASGSLEPSFVIKALGVGEERARSSIRFGIGRFNTAEEIDYVVAAVTKAVRKLRG